MAVFDNWLRQHDEFLQLMEASAAAGRASVEALKRIVTNPSVTPTLDEFVASRRKDKEITITINELLCRKAVTVFEREDIEALSGSLYRIPKTVEKFAERYILTAPQLRDVDFSRQTLLLEEATSVLLEMIKGLRERNPRLRLAELNARLQQIEGNADKLMLQLLREVYGQGHPPLKVVILKDLYELLEKGLDRCRDAGNVVFQIALRPSSPPRFFFFELLASLKAWLGIFPKRLRHGVVRPQTTL